MIMSLFIFFIHVVHFVNNISSGWDIVSLEIWTSFGLGFGFGFGFVFVKIKKWACIFIWGGFGFGFEVVDGKSKVVCWFTFD